MSSLQLRAGNSPNSAKTNFEISFASGLNLSEFNHLDKGKSSDKPASAALFEEKRKQAAQNILNDQEEARLELVAQQHFQRFKESLIKSKEEKDIKLCEPLKAAAPWQNASNDLIFGTFSGPERKELDTFQLVTSIHETDIHGAQREHSGKKIKNKRTKSALKSSNRKSRTVVKKSKRSKHRC